MAVILSLRGVAVIFLAGFVMGLWNGFRSHTLCAPPPPAWHTVPMTRP